LPLYRSFWQEGKGVAAIVCSFFGAREADAHATIGCRILDVEKDRRRHLKLHGDESLMPASA